MVFSDNPITDAEIKRAERIFLPKGTSFDEQRRKVIKSLETIDIQAAPGSGKTTVLLAKLFILSQRMPFKDGKGICVLTHTNVAIDEIKNRLGSKADILFSYPNFFGTFQSFVDKYLAIPYFSLIKHSRSIVIDQNYYFEKLNKQFIFGLKNFSEETQKHSRYFLKSRNGLLNNIRLRLLDGEVILTEGINGKEINVKRPRKSLLKKGDFSKEEKEDIYKWIRKLKEKILNEGILCYDDAYFLAEIFINKFEEKLNKVFSERFKYVFIDESQDTYSHQNWIIEKLFNEQVIIQRFGDLNQAIFESGKSNQISEWEPSNKSSLEISQSQRFGDSIANKLKTICIDRNNQIIGNSKIKSLKPHIILFNNNEISNVLENFVELIKKYNLHIPDHENKIKEFKVIGWRGTDTTDVSKKLCLSSYFPNFNKKINVKMPLYQSNLISYIRKLPESIVREKGIKVYYDSIIHAVLRFLYLADIKNKETKKTRYFTKSSLKQFLKDNYEHEYTQLKFKMAEWIYIIHNGQEEYNTEVYRDLKSYIINDLKSIWPDTNISKVKDFLEDDSIEVFENESKVSNIYTSPKNPEIEIKVDTVHSVKGETHKATLYLETYYNKIHDLRKILPFLKGQYDEKLAKQKTVQEALKVAYVGMSRPTHLLCLAMNSEGLTEKDIEELEDSGWEIIHI